MYKHLDMNPNLCVWIPVKFYIYNFFHRATIIYRIELIIWLECQNLLLPKATTTQLRKRNNINDY